MTFPPFYSIPGKGVERATPQVNMSNKRKARVMCTMQDMKHDVLESCRRWTVWVMSLICFL